MRLGVGPQHDEPGPAVPRPHVYLPGVAPTGRKVVLPHVVVMGFDEELMLIMPPS